MKMKSQKEERQKRKKGRREIKEEIHRSNR
jgi:hypothetical protein